MSTEQLITTIRNKILEKETAPKAFQALWDGDTQGWFILFAAVYANIDGAQPGYSADILTPIGRGDAIKYFTQTIPPFPETEIAQLLGEQFSKEYNVPFYFPSPREADDSCPNWWEQEKGIHCADCGKLIIPTTSEYLPKNICYNCHLERGQQLKLKENASGKENFCSVMYKNGQFRPIGIDGYFLASSRGFKREQLSQLDREFEVELITIEPEQIAVYKDYLYTELEKALHNYKSSDLTGERRKFGQFETIEFGNQKYELEQTFNETHRKISALNYRYTTAVIAASEHWTYKIYITKGLRYREESFLRYIGIVCNGKTSHEAILERYQGSLTELEILTSLKKLEKMKCIEIDQNAIYLTQIGRHVFG